MKRQSLFVFTTAVVLIVASLLNGCAWFPLAPQAAAPAAERPAAEAAPVQMEVAPAATEAPPSGEAAAAPAAAYAPAAPAYDLPPQDMFFQDYGVRGFVKAAKDNLSTFAVDVDTGSYTVARSYVQDGLLPPPDAIRPEEFINYFHYNYPNPEARRDLRHLPWTAHRRPLPRNPTTACCASASRAMPCRPTSGPTPT